MAAKVMITPEQYLATSYEWEPEYVRGEIVEKSLPNRIHGRIRLRLGMLLYNAGYCCVDVRVRLAQDIFRRPDVLVFEGAGPDELLPTSPPLIIVEISSPDDKTSDLFQKCEEYRRWGVPNIWFVEAELKKLYVYSGGLKEVTQFELPAQNITIKPSDLFE